MSCVASAAETTRTPLPGAFGAAGAARGAAGRGGAGRGGAEADADAVLLLLVVLPLRKNAFKRLLRRPGFSASPPVLLAWERAGKKTNTS